MTIEGNDNPTNREDAAKAGTPDQPSAMPRMSPPKETGNAVSPDASGRFGASAALRSLSVLLFWLLISVLIVGLLLPTLAHLREQSRRSTCARNLKGMGTGFYTFANESSDDWPILADHQVGRSPPRDVDYVGAIGSYRGKASNPRAGDVLELDTLPSKLSTTRGLWMLIRLHISTQKAFICPSTNDRPNADPSPEAYWDFGVGDNTGPATPEQTRQGWNQLSYGYQVPFGKYGQPNSNCDLHMVVAADKGPFGAALDGGLATPPPITARGESPPENWRPWNSPSHGGQGKGEGQNVLYTDAHVDWAPTPIVGVNNDNIYTQQASGELGRIQGNRPAPGLKLTPADDTDTLIYP